ncbi:hypothetical protein DLJ60_16020 [Micromonospora chalcea]|uniref:Uncharacterized protein n=1 Tax=Micromonospora chalcea TaxID=1874 RepID=A0ABX9Y2I3_MICCH|nr:hypothetical protein A8711_09960 [Micromonospora sp. II]RQW91935.1 hypothetical protein DLJ60_16020 [Micromonospora chalcea]
MGAGGLGGRDFRAALTCFSVAPCQPRALTSWVNLLMPSPGRLAWTSRTTSAKVGRSRLGVPFFAGFGVAGEGETTLMVPRAFDFGGGGSVGG